jgi:hypothetical protein
MELSKNDPGYTSTTTRADAGMMENVCRLYGDIPPVHILRERNVVCSESSERCNELVDELAC